MRLNALIALAIMTGLLASCDDDTKEYPVQPTTAVDLVADIVAHAVEGAFETRPRKWKKEGDALVVRDKDSWRSVKVTARNPCVYELELQSQYATNAVSKNDWLVDFTKLRNISNLGVTYPTRIRLASLVLEGDPGFFCFNKGAVCDRTKTGDQRTEDKDKTDRAVKSFEEFRSKYCPAAKAVQIVVREPAPPPPDPDAIGKNEPALADIQRWADSHLNKAKTPVKVTSSSCRSKGNREWQCDVVYEVFINNPQQLALAGYYENSITGVWGPQDGELRIVRDYRLVDQRRIR